MTNGLKESMNEFTEDFNRKIAQYFDKKIISHDDTELQIVWMHLKEYVLAGGKRLRPYILYKMNAEFRKLEEIDNILLAFEFLHNSTLIDDDIIDEHDSRRNKPTLSTIYNTKNYSGEYIALLAANLLRGAGIDLILASRLPIEFQRGCWLAYQNICRSIDGAQILDLEYRGKLNISEEKYIAQTDLVAAQFIAYMFQLCAPEEYRTEFFEAGRNFGIAFQLADDLREEIRKQGYWIDDSKGGYKVKKTK